METPFASVRLMEMMEPEMMLPLLETLPGLMTSTLTTVPIGRLFAVPFGKVTDPATVPLSSTTSNLPSGIGKEDGVTLHPVQDTEDEGLLAILAAMAGIVPEGLLEDSREMLGGRLFEVEKDTEGPSNLEDVPELERTGEREVDPDGESDGLEVADTACESDGLPELEKVKVSEGLLDSVELKEGV